jgi:polyisoprenyl-teichoic acid--peptidoglycan teichoic acid transferase
VARLQPGRRRIAVVAVTITSAILLLAAGAVSYLRAEAEAIFTPSSRLAEASSLLSPAPSGGPAILLLIGTDLHPGARRYADALILVRIDPSAKAVSITAVPRTEHVLLPGGGPGLLEETYALGGPRLTVEWVKRLTRLRVNFVAAVDAEGLRRLVDVAGGVYIDVDHRYAFRGQPGMFASIHIPAGYQRLDGTHVVQYVRDRHDDSDYVRLGRHLLVLGELRRQLERVVGSPSHLAPHPLGVISLLHAVAEAADVAGPGGAIGAREALHWVQALRAIPPDRVQTVPVASSDPVSLARALDRFLHPFTDGKPPATEGSAAQGSAFRNQDGCSAGLAPVDTNRMRNVFGDAGRRSGLPILYPAVIPGTSSFDSIRVYRIHVGDSSVPAVRATFACAAQGEYWGIQETSWRDPPILHGPSRAYVAGGRTYRLYFNGPHLHVVAFEQSGVAIWVSNTLLNRLSMAQMLAVARSLSRVTGSVTR